MEKICTLCHFTTHSDFSWESHLSRDEHRVKKMEADNAALIEALKGLINICTHPQATKADMKIIANEARAALAQAEG